MADGDRERRGAEAFGEAYDGARGRTRTEPVQVWMPDGTIRALSVYVGVDADADPALATLARAGTLHHIADGVDLAIPFVYHARAARLMLLVVPEGLRHRALALRAEHLSLIAADAGHALPEYVRDAELVIGARGLSARLDGGEPAAKLHSVAIAADDTRALLARERDLMRRERLVRAREQALRAAERRLPTGGSVDDSELEEVEELDTAVDEAVDDEAAEDNPYERVLVATDLTPSAEIDLGDVADNDAEPVEGDELSEAFEEGEENTDVEPVDANNDVEDVEDIEGSEAVETVEEELDEALLRVAPSAFADEGDEAELWLSEQDGRVWLFVRRRPSPPRDVSGLELLLQLDPDADVPMAVLTLVFDVEGSPDVRRGVIDPNDPAQVRALTLLSEHFEVELVSVLGPHEFEPWAILSAPREANARAVLGRLTRKADQDPAQFSLLRDLVLRAPPPWRELSHPFQPRQNQLPPQTATEAAVQLDELSSWLKPDRRERVRLLWSVPDELVDEHIISCLGAALDWGLSLPGPLAARAIELGLAHDQRALLERRLQGLCRLTRAPDDTGLEEGVLRAQWSEALEQAARLGVTLSAEALELAQKHAGERAVLHAEALSEEPSAALTALRERALAGAQVDLPALEELLWRGAYRDLVAGCRSLTRVSVEDAARLLALVARREDPAAVDALLSLLSADAGLRVRVGAALGLSQRRALHAIEETAASLAREDSPGWRLFALALGRYGGGSYRAVTRAIAAHKVDAERTALVLALLCCHGARAQVRAKARSTDEAEARLAERALALAADCKSDELLLIALEEGAELTVFCRIFDRSSAGTQV